MTYIVEYKGVFIMGFFRTREEAQAWVGREIPADQRDGITIAGRV